jgi:hypothetical protein
MKFTPGQEVIVLDTTNKAAGSATVQAYHPETHTYTVLFQYPNSAAPDSTTLPEHRLLTLPELESKA